MNLLWSSLYKILLIPSQTLRSTLLFQSLTDHPPSTINTMSDQDATLTPSPAPPAPTGPRPKVMSRGRTAVPVASSNSDATDVPEFEPFGAPGPRGFPPLTGEGLHCKISYRN